MTNHSTADLPPRKEHAMTRKCCFFHRWTQIGLSGPLSLLEECTKCGWQKEFNGFLDEERIYPPNTFKEIRK